MVLDVKARNGVDKVVAPIGKALAKIGIRPSAVTVGGLLITVVGAILIGSGELLGGGIVVAVGSLLDIIDGPLARVTGSESKRGALLDTLADRLGEAAIWIGLVYFLSERGRSGLATLAVVGLCAAMLVPYVRSKAEGWGAQGKGGLMGRAERLIVMLLGVGIEGIGTAVDTEINSVEPMLWVMAVATWLTVLQRAWRTWQQLGE